MYFSKNDFNVICNDIKNKTYDMFYVDIPTTEELILARKIIKTSEKLNDNNDYLSITFTYENGISQTLRKTDRQMFFNEIIVRNFIGLNLHIGKIYYDYIDIIETGMYPIVDITLKFPIDEMKIISLYDPDIKIALYTHNPNGEKALAIQISKNNVVHTLVESFNKGDPLYIAGNVFRGIKI